MRGFRIFFIKEIRASYPDEYAKVISLADANYHEISKDTAFALTSKNPLDRRLDFSAYFLALIMTLDRRGESFDNIRRICLEVVTDYVRPKNGMSAFFKRLIPKLITGLPGRILINLFHWKISTNSNTQGFVARVITDKKETFGLGYGVDILECGICKLFKKYNFERYAPILCEVDEITSGMAGLKLIRKGTIANGAEKCDFRFQRVEHSARKNLSRRFRR